MRINNAIYRDLLKSKATHTKRLAVYEQRPSDISKEGIRRNMTTKTTNRAEPSHRDLPKRKATHTKRLAVYEQRPSDISKEGIRRNMTTKTTNRAEPSHRDLPKRKATHTKRLALQGKKDNAQIVKKVKSIKLENIKKKTANPNKRKLALLLPGHNEELIIQATINSAIAAGQSKDDIFVVDDNSSDKTRKEAIELLGREHVLTVPRSGKAGAVNAAIHHFKIEDRYRWVHVADADSVFGHDYFNIYRKALTGTDCTLAVGFVQSLRGNWLSHYRALSYTYSQHVIRRAQSWLGLISVFPGPITAFRTDIIPQLDFLSETLTEDFDITLQFHRKKLGKIKFIPGAVNYTQDPQTLKDFCKQTARWQRGFFQGVGKYRIGTKLQRIDFSIGYQMLEMLLFIFTTFVFVPYVIISTGKWVILPVMFVADLFVTSLLAILSALAIKRITVLAGLPYFYFLRWLEFFIFAYAFIEIAILKKFKTHVVGWQTEGRRYALDSVALKDVAK